MCNHVNASQNLYTLKAFITEIKFLNFSIHFNLKNLLYLNLTKTKILKVDIYELMK